MKKIDENSDTSKISKEEYKSVVNKRVETDSEERANFSPPLEIPATPFRSCPETCEEMVNTYGTYNIQATANSANDFPAIAQGTPPYIADRTHKFFRDGSDTNPAADTSDEDSI